MVIIDEYRLEVIENIKEALEEGDFYAKVEVNDPVLTLPERNRMLKKVVRRNYYPIFKFKKRITRWGVNKASKMVNKKTDIIGIEKLDKVKGGAIITSNHFSPIENAMVRMIALRDGKRYLPIVIQETNVAMKGLVGFLMNHADTIPISVGKRYIKKFFEPQIRKYLKKKKFVLIYPEQEMWFNYRKPRPGKRGPYYFAAKNNVPVISVFVEMRDTDKKINDDFVDVEYTTHILGVLYPDPNKTVRANSLALKEQDDRMRKEVYERIYGKKLDYKFDSSDIAGWISHK